MALASSQINAFPPNLSTSNSRNGNTMLNPCFPIKLTARAVEAKYFLLSEVRTPSYTLSMSSVNTWQAIPVYSQESSLFSLIISQAILFFSSSNSLLLVTICYLIFRISAQARFPHFGHLRYFLLTPLGPNKSSIAETSKISPHPGQRYAKFLACQVTISVIPSTTIRSQKYQCSGNSIIEERFITMTNIKSKKLFCPSPYL